VLAAGHDIGKITVGFQRKCPAWLVEHGLAELANSGGWQFSESNHAAISQDFFFGVLRTGKARRWAIAVGGHHGRFLGKGRVAKPESDANWTQPVREKLFNELTAIFSPPPDEPPESDEQLLLVAGWMTVADWIGSNERFFPLLTDYTIESSRARANQALEEIRLGKGSLRPGVSFQALFKAPEAPAGLNPNPLQRLCLDSIKQPGLYLIEAPMGSGKTEAALAVAHRLIAGGYHHGLYFALPTQLTSNRIHERVEQFLRNALAEETDHPLAHANSWLHRELHVYLRPAHAEPDKDEWPDQHAAVARSWFASSRQALLARHGVGTVDQALLGAVAACYCAVRLFGLAGKVVILDEVHSYDAYTSSVLDKLIQRLLALRCTVLVLSATLTTRRREQLLKLANPRADVPAPNGYPLLSCVEKDGEVTALCCDVPAESVREVAVQCRFAPGPPLLDEVCEQAERGACVLLIKNTVAEAQETFRALQSIRRVGGPEIGLLHSRFPQFRREEQEARWMERLGKPKAGVQRPPGCVLVATQVVEQSVDIDADLLVTDLAPTDLLLQRIGRLWRHPRSNRPVARPETWVVCPELPGSGNAKELRNALGKSARVYPPYVLLRSLEIWRDTPLVRLPEGIRPLLDATYAERAETTEPTGWLELRQELEKQVEQMRHTAGLRSNVLEMPELNDEEGMQTRWNGLPSGSLILLTTAPQPNAAGEVQLAFLNGEGVVASSYEWRFCVAAAIHRNAVKLPLYAIRDALHSEAQPAWLRLHFRGAAVFGVLDAATGQIPNP
jgi:CRISPR-associated endonuclease/helicase Cas3